MAANRHNELLRSPNGDCSRIKSALRTKPVLASSAIQLGPDKDTNYSLQPISASTQLYAVCQSLVKDCRRSSLRAFMILHPTTVQDASGPVNAMGWFKRPFAPRFIRSCSAKRNDHLHDYTRDWTLRLFFQNTNENPGFNKMI